MYHFECICGQKITSPGKTGSCPSCARLFDIRWPGDAAPVAVASGAPEPAFEPLAQAGAPGR